MAVRGAQAIEGMNQNSRRSYAIYFDQHRSKEFPDGRPWGGVVEAPADPKHRHGVVGELSPISADMTTEDGTFIRGWDAPWVPESKYIMHAVGLAAGNRFRINYQAMISDYKTASESYYFRVAEACHNANLTPPPLYGAVPFQIRALKSVGNPPKSPKIPEAALAGDQWILGFGQEKNDELKAILDRDAGKLTEQETTFVKGAIPVQPQTSEFSPDEIAAAVTALRQVKQQKKTPAKDAA